MIKKRIWLEKSFLLDFVGGEPFLLEMEQYPAFWGYCPPLVSSRNFLYCSTRDWIFRSIGLTIWLKVWPSILRQLNETLATIVEEYSRPKNKWLTKVSSKFGVYRFLVWSEFQLINVYWLFLNINSRLIMVSALFLHNLKYEAWR